MYAQVMRALRLMLASGMNDSEAERDLCCTLEWTIPGLLAERHACWRAEALDGVLPISTKLVGHSGLELYGRCILIADQSLLPLLVTLRLDSDETLHMSVRIGEPSEGAGDMNRVRYGSREAERQFKALLLTRPNQWAYTVETAYRLH